MVRLGQTEVFKYFETEYLTGNKEFISINQVVKAFDLHKSAIRRDVIKLYAWGYLDIEVKERWKRKYRIKQKYINKGTKPQSIFGRKEEEE